MAPVHNNGGEGHFIVKITYSRIFTDGYVVGNVYQKLP